MLDYDDLLLYWAGMMQAPELAAEIGARFDHVLVDEYQDTNRLQAAILLALKPDGRGLTVVGDDAQSIYAFRAAEVRNILDFPDLFRRRPAIVALEQNYRSTPDDPRRRQRGDRRGRRGLRQAAAQRPAGADRGRRWSRSATRRGRSISSAARSSPTREAGTALKEQAVLFRTAHHSGPLEVELTRRNIPFVKFGGLKFLDAAHVKDLLACLRFAQNPADRVAGFRVLQLVPGIGPATAEAVLDAMAGARSRRWRCRAPRCRARARRTGRPSSALFAGLRAGDAAAGRRELGAVRAWYDPHLERLHEDAGGRAGPISRSSRRSPRASRAASAS